MMTTEAKLTCKKCGKTRPFSDGSDLRCYRCVERREHIATAVLAGLWSNITTMDETLEDDEVTDKLVRFAIKQADALIAELDKESK